MSDWRYFATRLHGDGTETMIASELPLSGVSITKVLSGPDEISGTIPVELAHLKGEDGEPVLLPWATALYAEHEGVIRGGGIVTDVRMEDGRLALTASGFRTYIDGIPYVDDRQWIQEDPLNLARHIWDHAQAQEGGNLGVILDETTSPVRVGTETEDVEFETGQGNQVSFEAGPYKLNFYSTHNLGQEFDNLAEATPFDYAEYHEWVGDVIRHRIRLGYPMLGRMRNDLRFAIGENVMNSPAVSLAGDEYASEVIVLGAGEGRKMVRGYAAIEPAPRLRRPVVITDKSARSVARANSIARSELRLREGSMDISTLLVRDHPHAPIGSWQEGDVIRVVGNSRGWGGDLYMLCRILDFTYQPGDTDLATLTVTRVERTTDGGFA